MFRRLSLWPTEQNVVQCLSSCLRWLGARPSRLTKDAEHIIVMENGKVVEEWTHETRLEQKGCYWEMCSEEAVSAV